MTDMNAILSSHHLLLLTFDALRLDVAQAALAQGKTPHLRRLLGAAGWEPRHSPGNFTYASHMAFFSGFLPTPSRPGLHRRLFACSFAGSGTVGRETCVFKEPDIVNGLAARGFHTVCIGGVGFFNKKTALGAAMPSLFAESHWRPGFGVSCQDSAENQFRFAAALLDQLPPFQRVFLFINISALHEPTSFYLGGKPSRGSPESQAAALAYVDSCLPILTTALEKRGDWFSILTSDHGTCFGENGYYGHRVSLPCVLEVPYGEAVIKGHPVR